MSLVDDIGTFDHLGGRHEGIGDHEYRRNRGFDPNDIGYFLPHPIDIF